MSVLLVGTGPMATAYARVLNALRVPFIAVGRGADSAKKFRAECGVDSVLGGLEAFLTGQSTPSGVTAVVALPISDLAWATKRLVRAGYRRILVEKPAGLSAEEIEDVALAGARADAQIVVAYNRRFYASVMAAQAMIAEDGGVTSFHMEFTEIESRILKSGFPASVLSSWFLANSSHVVDLAFHLGGEPLEMSGMTEGTLSWHPDGAVFVGHGRTTTGAAFTWHADWLSAGRWGVDIRTPRRRLLLQPLEQLVVQKKDSFILEPHPIADELDREYKPGLYRQVEAFLSGNMSSLLTIAEHARRTRNAFAAICSAPSGRTSRRDIRAASQ